MRVLVLGASGFVGAVLYKKLAETPQYHVFGASRSGGRGAAAHQECDICVEKAVRALLENLRPDVLIWTIKDTEHEDSITDNGLRNVLQYKPSDCRIIYVSTNVYNGGRGPYRESVPSDYVAKGHPADAYVLAKVRAEQMIAIDRDALVLRPGVIFGKTMDGQWDRRISGMVSAVSRKEHVFLSQNRYATWVDVDVLTDVIIGCVDRKISGILHVGSELCESGYSINLRIAGELCLDTQYIVPIEDGYEDNSFDLELYRYLFRE